jgi:hypothetical protein
MTVHSPKVNDRCQGCINTGITNTYKLRPKPQRMPDTHEAIAAGDEARCVVVGLHRRRGWGVWACGSRPSGRPRPKRPGARGEKRLARLFVAINVMSRQQRNFSCHPMAFHDRGHEHWQGREQLKQPLPAIDHA